MQVNASTPTMVENQCKSQYLNAFSSKSNYRNSQKTLIIFQSIGGLDETSSIDACDWGAV